MVDFFSSVERSRLIQNWVAILQFALLLSGAIWAYIRLRKERTHIPHIEFGIDCRLLGPVEDDYIAQFALTVANRGAVIHRFPSIKLRARGIRANQELAYWRGHEPRLEFPDVILPDVEVIPEGYNYFFVEPGVKQELVYVTKIPANYGWFLTRAEFHYDRYSPHSSERVFEVPSA